MRSILSIVLLFSCLNLHGQNETGRHPRTEAVMKEYIKKLKDGVLLVRLMTKQNSIDQLRKNGDNAAADKIEQNQRKINKDIISGFKSSFTFCPVKFFFSNYTEQIRKKEFDKVVFLNDSLLPDNASDTKGKFFLTAEFGAIEQDTASYYTGEDLYSGEKGLAMEKSYGGGPNMGFQALVIKSDQFFQLQRPFPYYAKLNSDSKKKDKYSKPIKKMNENLFSFYRQSQN